MPEARRAAVALAALVALAAGAAILLAYHLAHAPPASVEAVAGMCRLPGAASSLDRAAAPTPPAWVAIGLLFGGLVFALARLIRTLRSTRRVAARLAPMRAAAAPSVLAARVAARAADLGVPVSPVVADLDGRPAAFTMGFVRPRIVVSMAVAEALTDAELDALLLHEAAHARRRDPLRLVAAGFCRDLLFFLPLGHALFRLAVEAQERAADDAAAEAAGPLEVASALLAFLKLAGRRPALGVTPAAVGADPEARIRRLLGLPEARRSRGGSLPRAGANVLALSALLAGLAGVPARAAGAALTGCCAVMAAVPGPSAPYC